MPIYEYQCQKCGKPFEFEQRMADKPKSRCPSCRGKLQKLISLTGFQLKGSGWYKDGYASPKKESKPPSPSESPSPSKDAPQPPPKKETPDPKPAKDGSKKRVSKS